MVPGKVSIVVPTFNRAGLLVESLQSAMLQSYDNLEIVVVDDAGTDDTEAAVARLMAADRRLRYDRLPEWKPHSYAMQHGMDATDGEFVQFLDSDDLLHREKLRVQTEMLNAMPEIDLAVSHSQHFYTRTGELDLVYNTFEGEDPLTRFVSHDVVWVTICALWRRSCLEGIGGISTDLTCHMDYELHTRALILGAKPFLHPHVLSFYRLHEGQTIGKLPKPQRVRTLFGIFKKMAGLLRERGIFEGRLKRETQTNYLWTAFRAAHYEMLDVCAEALEEAAALGEVEGMDALCAAAASGNHDEVMRLLEPLGITLFLREGWYASHRLSQEHIEPIPAYSRYRRRADVSASP